MPEESKACDLCGDTNNKLRECSECKKFYCAYCAEEHDCISVEEDE